MSTRSWSTTSLRVNPSASQSAKYEAHSQIKALDISPGKTHTILAGREILKIVRVGSTEIDGDLNLRSSIINYTPSRGPGPSTILDIHDVKWSHTDFSSCLATAASNGRINIYDVNRAGTETAQVASLHEHGRQVHKLAFNPFNRGNLLLSGSQDSTVKLWDLRQYNREALSCRIWQTFHGQSESVRDLSWSPAQSSDFAFGTDTGTIQHWDLRYPNTPQLKINAHVKTCHAVDWHPDGKHLLSASSDRTIKVWQITEGDRRQKPLWEIKAPYKVWGAKWRPACFSADYQDSNLLQTTQIATFYRSQALIHVWDFRRPSLPFREIREYNAQPSGMLWKNEDLLWTVTGGDDGTFVQTNTQFSQKVLDRRNLQAFGLSPDGEISCMLQKRPRRCGPPFQYHNDHHQKGRKISPEKMELSRSFVDETAEDGFLSSSAKKRHGRSSSYRSTKSAASTPPNDGSRKMMMSESMERMLDGNHCDQLAFQGTLPGAVNSGLFTFLAQKYKAMPPLETLDNNISLAVEDLFNRNAEYAQQVACFRLAQSWKILGLAMSKTLERRRQKILNRLPERSNTREPLRTGLPKPQMVRRYDDNSVASSVQITKKNSVPPIHVESTSNMTTPLARPSKSTLQANNTDPDPLDSDDNLTLPPSSFDNQSQKSRFNQHGEKEATRLQRNAYYDSPELFKTKTELDERRARFGSWQAQPKVPLNLDPKGEYTSRFSATDQLERYDSMDSFQMISASSDSQDAQSIPNSFPSRSSESRFNEKLGEWAGDQTERRSKYFEKDHVPSTRADEKTNKSDGHSNLDANAMSATRTSHTSSTSATEYESAEHAASQGVFERSPYTSFDSDTSYAGSAQQEVNSMAHSDYASVVDGGPVQPVGILRQEGIVSKDHYTKSHGKGYQNSVVNEQSFEEEETEYSEDDDESVWGLPFAMIDMLRKLIEYHSLNLADSQTLSHFLLLLIPLLPTNHPLPHEEVSSTMKSYAEHLAGTELSPSEIAGILEKHLIPITQTGINPLQVEAVLSTYHSQLLSLNLHNAATRLRRMSYPAYSTIYDQSLKDVSVGLLCQTCNKPIHNPKDKMRCESCRARQASCPVCWSTTSPYQNLDKKKLKRDEQLYRTIITSPATADDVCPKPLPANHISNPSLPNQMDDTNYNYNYSSYPSMSAYNPRLSTVSKGHIPLATTPQKDGKDSKLTLGATSTSAAASSSSFSTTHHEQPHRPSPSAVSSPPCLWSWCALCGHGGHMSCLLTWFSDPVSSSGACPTEGCLCDCVRGTARAGKTTIWTKQYQQQYQQQQQKGKTVKKGTEMNGGVGFGIMDSVAAAPFQGQQATSGARRVGFI